MRRAALLAGVAWVAVSATPALGQDVARLPSVTTPPTTGPPLETGARPREVRLPPGRIASDEQVVVELRQDGTPMRVRVRQRLTVEGAGDYAFGVPAPLLSATPAPGSQSSPGSRTGLVLWQGFSSGGRILAADVRLRPADAESALPLRFSVSGGTQGRVLSIENVTGTLVEGVAFGGAIGPADAQAVLDELRASVLRDVPAGERYVTVDGLTPAAAVRTGVSLRVTGTVRVTGPARRFSRVVPPGSSILLELPAAGRITIAVTAVTVAPESVTRPRAGVGSGSALLAQVIAARLDAARYRQFTQFLANPDRLGEARATYVFRSAPVARAAAAPADDGSGVVLVAVVACLIAAAIGLPVWWAHS